MLHEMATIYKKAWGREPLDIVVAAKQKISSKISSAIGRKASDSRQGTTTGYAEFSRHALQRTSVSLPQAMHIYRIAAANLTVSVRHQHQVQSDLHIDGNRKHGLFDDHAFKRAVGQKWKSLPWCEKQFWNQRAAKVNRDRDNDKQAHGSGNGAVVFIAHRAVISQEKARKVLPPVGLGESQMRLLF